MKYTVLTLFPEITDAFFATSIMAKAIRRGIIEYRAINIRDFALDKHKTCDDAPYGGGPGMLMLPEPLGRALEAAGARAKELPEQSGGGVAGAAAPAGGEAEAAACPSCGGQAAAEAGGGLPPPRVIYLSPPAETELVLLCGRYEGIDQRIIGRYVDDEISVGDYVLSSGEAAALVLIDATYRLVDQVITPESLAEESFSGGLLEYPQYTRPEVYDTLKVPEVLLSGHHELIRRWRLEQRVARTLRLRPDLIRRGRELGLFNGEILGIIDRQAADGESAAGAEGDETNE